MTVVKQLSHVHKRHRPFIALPRYFLALNGLEHRVFVPPLLTPFPHFKLGVSMRTTLGALTLVVHAQLELL